MRNDWLHRTTKQLILNTSPGDMLLRFPALVFVDADGKPASNAEWIYDPDMSAVDGWPSRYWIITGDIITLMDETQRASTDLALLEAARDQIATQLDNTEDIVRAFMLVVLDELNLHSSKINSIMMVIDGASTLAEVKSGIAAISDIPTRTAQQLRDAIRDKLGL